MMGVHPRAAPEARDLALLGAMTVGALAGGALIAVSAYAVHPLALPSLLLVAAFVVMAFLRPAWGLAGALLLTPLETVELPLPTLGLSASEGAFAVAGIAWLARVALRPDSVRLPGLRDVPIVVLVLAVATGLLVAVEPAPVLRVATLWTVFVLAYFQAQSLTPREMRIVLISFAVGAGILGVLGATRYVQVGGTELLAGGERAAAAFADPNYYASLLALALLPALALVIGDVKRNVWLIVPAAGALVGLALSLSRGGILGFGVGLLMLLAWRRARRVALVLVALLVLLTVAGANPIVSSDYFGTVEERLSSIRHPTRESNRPEIWATAVDITAANPFTGIGVNQFQFEASSRRLFERGDPIENAHSIYLGLAAEMGLIALAAFLGFLVQLALRAGLAARAPDRLRRALGLGMMGALVAFLVQGLTSAQIRVPLLVGAFLVLAGMLTRLADDARGVVGAAQERADTRRLRGVSSGAS
jgi:O-antigen ligase